MARQRIPHKYRDAPKGIFGTDISDRLAALIGRCVCAATEVEVHLSLTMGSLLGVENPASVAVFATLRNARARRDALLAAATHSLDQELFEIFRAIIVVYERLDSTRNDIVHGVWGYIADVDDSALWCKSQDAAVWHINDYHRGASGSLTSEWRNDQWFQYVYLWSHKDIEEDIKNIKYLSAIVGNFHACLRYRDEPAGDSARRQLDNEPLLQKALEELRTAQKAKP